MINEKGIWSLDTAEKSHYHSVNLAEFIAKEFDKNVTVNDIGCGDGYYCKYLSDKGFKKIQAFEGTPDIENMGVYNPIIQTDLSEYINKKYIKKESNSICLEVGEHIPKEYESVFLDNICNLTINKIIFSWAVIGQGGEGHVNCQDNDYIIEQMKTRGFEVDVKKTKQLRDIDFNGLTYFKNTLFYMVRK
jgi:hypothetical protein